MSDLEQKVTPRCEKHDEALHPAGYCGSCAQDEDADRGFFEDDARGVGCSAACQFCGGCS